MATVASRAKNSTLVEAFGRVGMVCYGVVYLIVAYLAVQAAFGANAQPADQKGALEKIASTPFGAAVLWVLAIGLFAFGLWQLLLAAVSFHWYIDKRKRLMKRAGAAVRGIVGIALGVAAIRTVTRGGGGSSNDTQRELTARLLALPAGRVLVIAVAVIVIGAGVGSVVSGARRSFMRDLDTGELPAGTQRWVRRLGVLGNVAKGVAIVIVGVLLGIAGLRSDAGRSGGLDAALHTLAGQPFGQVLLIAMAFGFAAFGIFCFAAARSQRV
jgi:hypothetical protein